MKVGLLFGSFNPIHTGHLIIANLALSTTEIQEVWFVVSPQNPFKKNKTLLHEFDRYDMVHSAISEDYHFKVSDVEFQMPRPSYTIDTLTVLSEKHPTKEFSLIIGEDNLDGFSKWKNHDKILEYYHLIVYPRPGAKKGSTFLSHPNVHYMEAPEIDISATFIRDLIRKGQSIKYLVPDSVIELIKTRKLFS